MTASMRGHQAVLKVFKNGQNADLVTITRFEVNQDSTFQRSHYVGNPIPEGDQTQEGWSGSFDTEVKGPEVDDLVDALVTANLNGIGVEECTIMATENYADGRTQSYVYADCQFKMSKTQPAQTEKITKRVEFQSQLRIRL